MDGAVFQQYRPVRQSCPVRKRWREWHQLQLGFVQPRPGVVNDDNFSARYSSVQLFNAGTYEFIVSSDDGVRVFIDGVLVLDRYIGRAHHRPLQYTLTAGTHCWWWSTSRASIRRRSSSSGS
ncbi:MAG: hypothetical protein IPK19_30230 [Chloroflexi bacterium]|nr:hypothetical protein [Chloroflexota bacterium]